MWKQRNPILYHAVEIAKDEQWGENKAKKQEGVPFHWLGNIFLKNIAMEAQQSERFDFET